MKGAQEIARVHEAVSHPAWRDRFKSIYAPEALIEDPAEDKGSEARQGRSPRDLDFKMEGAALVISAYSVDEVEVRSTPINLEILFSNNPLSLEGQRVSVSPLIKPSFTQVVKLSETGETRFELPEAWRQRALQVEVKRGAMSQVRSYAPQSFKQHIFKQRGLMRLSDASALMRR